MPGTAWQAQLSALVKRAQARIIAFAQRVLRTPSLSGQEGALAALVQEEMRALGYDAVETDAVGNVIGRLNGGPGRTLLLHAHMDIVDPGDATLWSHPPFGGELADGYLWGRGASDTKGCLVAQVYALGLLREAGLRPAGDAYMAAVVCEELGGLGTQQLLRAYKPDLAIIGEPSGNTLRRGHRGRYEFVVTWYGRSAHASAPERGLNPHYAMARFLLALRETPLPSDETFRGSSVAPTLLYVDQTSANVIPAQVSVHLDWRSLPGQTAEDARRIVQQVLDATLEPEIRAEISVRARSVRPYPGGEYHLSHAMPGFHLEADDPRLLRAQAILQEALGHPVPVEVWTFTTDGGQLAEQGVACLGFGPGEEALAHVRDERLSIAQLLEGTVAYMALALKLGR